MTNPKTIHLSSQAKLRADIKRYGIMYKTGMITKEEMVDSLRRKYGFTEITARGDRL